MNSQQKQFADEYLIDLNGTKAAIRAGYSENSAAVIASQLLDVDDIANYISEKQKKVSDKLGYTLERVLLNFAKIHDRCMQGEPVLDHEGNETGEWKFEPMAALKANENIGKHLGFYSVDNAQKAPLIALMNLDPLSTLNATPTDDSTTEDSGA